jgi:putative nucleotidyltransferase with HDIG domain
MFSQNKNPRLSQWNGRRRSSRSEESVLPSLWHKPVLVRLGLVLATVLLVTYVAYVAYVAAPPLPYRVGEIFPRSLRVRVAFELVNQPQTDHARDEAVARLPPELSRDPAAREKARESVPSVVEQFAEGLLLVPRGEPLTERQLTLLEEEHRAYQHSLGSQDHARRALGLFLVMSLLAIVVVLYVARFQPSLAQSAGRIGSICLLVVLTLAVGLFLNREPWHAEIVPLTITALVLTLAYNPQFALLLSFSLTLAKCVAIDEGLNALLIELGGLATAILLLRNLRTRTRLVEVCAVAGAAYMAMTVATELFSGQNWGFILLDAARNLIWGTVAGFLLSGSLPLIERCFGIITDISLSELADGSHPLLQELIRRAPGTYTHSMTVAIMAEAAAEAIGANPLLTRVGSSFHDIGKMLKPQYFIENQTGENRHDFLEPALSTLVIIGHVKDGMALARQYGLPRPIIEFIQQHHGTTLVEYFYHEALRHRDQHEHGNGELESTFRYPGPRPCNREIGILMLADAVESTSRALNDPAPGSLRKLVHELLMKRLLDGQFDESGLTLTELHLIEASLCKSLIALYHARIKYPEQDVREAAS